MLTRLLVLLFLFPVLSFGTVLNTSNYNEDVLDIFSKIMPRFIIMSTQKANIDTHIEICILSDKMDEPSALSLITRIDENHPKGIKQHPLKLVHTDYSHMEACRNSQLAFLFNTTPANIEGAIGFSEAHSILTMSYDANYLAKGVNVSLFLGRKVIPYINMDSLGKSRIELNNILVHISKIYHDEDGR